MSASVMRGMAAVAGSGAPPPPPPGGDDPLPPKGDLGPPDEEPADDEGEADFDVRNLSMLTS